MMEHQQTTGISAPLYKHTHQVKDNQHRDEKIYVHVCVSLCVCAQCKVCACVLVSYGIIQAYVYLADEIILLSANKW